MAHAKVILMALALGLCAYAAVLALIRGSHALGLLDWLR